jgi:hypothetical protein
MGALLLWSERESNQLNAGVRWTPACRRLDGGNTLIFAIGENANRLPYPSPFTGHPTRGALLLWSERESNQLNAGVRCTPACRRLDGGNTLIFAIGENANRLPYPPHLQGIPQEVLFILEQKGVEPIKCNSPVDCCSCPTRQA